MDKIDHAMHKGQTYLLFVQIIVSFEKSKIIQLKTLYKNGYYKLDNL